MFHIEHLNFSVLLDSMHDCNHACKDRSISFVTLYVAAFMHAISEICIGGFEVYLLLELSTGPCC